MLNLSPTHWLLAFILGLLLELCLGEPKRFHPLVGFGWLASSLERRFNLAHLSQIAGQSNWHNILRGALAWLLLIGASLAAFALLKHFIGWWADALALWFALGARSLFEHVRAIARPLSTGDLVAARLALSRIVSRNCTELDDTGIAKAGLESTLENGADAIFASLFFFALFGGYGVLLHRLANTLDAMWGYKTVRLFHFGRIAARADDVLNFIPARLTALSYTLLGHCRSAFSCWQNQAPLWDSPNAGPVMASGAGALQVSLGGEATYHGEIHSRPELGCGPVPTAHDLQRGIVLVQNGPVDRSFIRRLIMDAVNQPQHGGDLQRAVSAYGGDLADWIDCSSGIAPWAYPLPAVPDHIWQRLPDQDHALLLAAQNYYGCEHLLALAGSQVGIALLPKLRPACRVAIISPTYAEHHWQWQQAGHEVIAITSKQVDKYLESRSIDVLIVVNPNNPSGQHLSASTLLSWHEKLVLHGGWMIVDEAFADCAPAASLLPHAGKAGLIILRSIGKFFGLAGIRLGFIACEKQLLEEIKQALGPWHISGPAQWAGQIALSDKAWQAAQQQRLLANQESMIDTLSEAGLAPSGSLPLLHWCPTPNAKALHSQLAKQKIWCRLFDQNNHQGLRFGPVAEHQQAQFKTRLIAALSNPTMVL